MEIAKQLYEAHLQQIFRMLLENKTNEQIAFELKISVRTVQNYKRRLEKRYGDYQREKTDNTLFLECQLFNRMLHLYKILEKKAEDPKVNGNECAKCCEVAANNAIDVLKIESEGIKAVKEDLGLITKAAKAAKSLPSAISNSDMMDELEKSC